MPRNQIDIVVFDLETSGLDPLNGAEAIQVAGKAYNATTLEPYPVESGGEFCSMMRPLHPERLDEPSAKKALQVNKKTKEEILGAPEQKLVWNQFVEWVGKYNRKRTAFGAPIVGGKNVRNFDMRFVEILNELHCPKKKKTVLFNKHTQLELQDDLFRWFENDPDPDLPNMSMDTVRDYFGLSREGSHDALTDVRQTGELIMKFLNIHRTLRQRKTKEGQPLIPLKGACSRP